MTATTKLLAICLATPVLLLAGSAPAMSRGDLINVIAAQTDLEESESARIFDAFVATTANALKRGDRIVLLGFGSFSVTRRMAEASCFMTTYAEFVFDPAAKRCESAECHACTTYDVDIADGMAIAAQLDPRLAAVVLDIIKREITRELFVANRVVHLAGFGRFSVVLEAEVTRVGGGVPNAKELKVGARKVVRFAPGEDLNLAIR